MNNADGFV